MSGSILEHVRIIELSHTTATSLACQLLAETGADVIRVEPPGGDPQRHQPGFAVWNRSKRSVILDLADAVQRQRFDAFLAGAGLVVETLAMTTPAAQSA